MSIWGNVHFITWNKWNVNTVMNQAREFDSNGKPVKDIDFTDHGRPNEHDNPHEHPYMLNETGGTPQRGPGQPLNSNH